MAGESIESQLIKALTERLEGTDSHGQPLTYEGAEVPVHTGSGDGEGKYVVIGRPRTRGKKFISGERKREVRQQIRCFTSGRTGSADQLDAYDIAENVQQLLEAAPITVDGKDLHIQEADRQPIPKQDQGATDAYEIALSYTFYL